MTLFKKVLVSAFIAVHLVMIATTAFPDRSAVAEKFLALVAPYQIFFGLDQTWSMFAPNPASVNSYLTATLTFKDGSTEKWTFPRSSQIDGLKRFTAGERYRKYQQENLVPMEKSELWFDLSRYVAREVARIEKSGPGRELDQIQFYRHSNVIQPPTKIFIPHGQLSTAYASESVFHFKSTGEMRHEASNNH